MTGIAVACAANSVEILSANLALSPMIAGGSVPLEVSWNAPSAAIALNRALDATTAPVVVLAHQDVYLPQGWERRLTARIAEVAALDADWALLGAFGIGLDRAHVGPVWSSSLGMIVGRVPLAPVRVQSFDEMLIVLRRDSGLRFDEALRGWHFYGTDIVQTARARGLHAYACGLPAVHNDRYHGDLGPEFTAGYRAMQRKWAGVLPLVTPITKISRHGLHLLRDIRANRLSAKYRLGMAVGTDTDPRVLAQRCGWSDLGAGF